MDLGTKAQPDLTDRPEENYAAFHLHLMLEVRNCDFQIQLAHTIIPDPENRWWPEQVQTEKESKHQRWHDDLSEKHGFRY